jgi:hypothetical protein
MKRILLENTGRYTIVDDEDYKMVMSFGKWYEKDNGYAVKKTRVKGKNVNIRMHRLVTEAPEGLVVDHINGDKLDNRQSNLRCVSQQINSWNMSRDYERKYDLPKGISFDKSRNKYVATKTFRRRFETLKQAEQFVAESEI